MGIFNLEDNLRDASGKEPWEPIWDPPPKPESPRVDWEVRLLGLAGAAIILGALGAFLYFAH